VTLSARIAPLAAMVISLPRRVLGLGAQVLVVHLLTH